MCAGEKVDAAPRASSYCPEITRTFPAEPGSAISGIVAFSKAWYFGAAILCLRGRLTQICIMWNSPPWRAKLSSWYSLCRMPPPAVIHCTSSGRITPPLPALSRCATEP
jgi:hypothetical protein